MRENKKSTNAAESGNLLELLYEVGRILASTEKLRVAAPPIIETICRNAEFEIGELWILDESETVLRLKSFWHFPAPSLTRFAAESQAFDFAVGEGLPGKIRQENAPVLVEKIGGEEYFLRRQIAAEAGLQSGVGFPVRLGEKFFGAFCFFRENSLRRDERLLETFAAVGGSVGQFIERVRVEKSLRQSKARYQAFIEQSTEGIWRLELDEPFSVELPVNEQVAAAARRGYLAECNDAMARMYGLQKAEELVGKRIGDLLDMTDAKNVKYLRAFIESGYNLTDAESHEKDVNGDDVFFLNSLVGTVENGNLIRVWGTQRDITEQKRAAARLRENDAVLQTINQSSPTLIYLKDRAGRMLNANPATLEVIGRPLAEIIGRTHSEYTGNEFEGAAIAANDRRIVEGGATETFEEKVLANGVLRTFISTKTPYRDERGAIIGLVGVSFDITTRKRAEIALSEARARLEATLTAGEIGTWLWDIKNDAVFADKNLARMFAVSEANADGGKIENYLNAIHAADREQVGAMIAELLAGGSDYFEADYRLVSPKGNICWVVARGTVERDAGGAAVSLPGVVLDITGRKKAESERELLFVEAQKARETAERANHSKDEFIALVSHELRSPLNAMLGWTRILQKKQADEKTTEYALDVIVRNALSQSRLIEDLLDIARIGEGKLRIEMRATAIIPIIKAAIEIIKPAAEAKQISIVESFDAAANFIHGDDDRLRQVIENLLSNAVKFTPPDGKIEIALKRNDKQTRLVVRDSGQGIPAGFLPEVFEKFRQADPSTTRRHGGLGIGLSLARDLVELHGGTISAESEGENTGATFTVTLPLRAVLPIKQNSDTEGAMSSQGKLSGFWILAVDDEADAREIVSFMLQINGAKVTTANSAVEALEILKDTNGRVPDLLLSDISMPFESGYALLEKIRALPREHGGDIPAVALTAFNRPEDREAAFEAGFQKHLGKPVDMDALIDAIVETARAKQI